MSTSVSARLAELTARSPELRSALAELRREIEILKRREQIRERQLRQLRGEVEVAGRLQRELIQGPLPEICGAVLGVFAHPAEGITGDFHHVRRISEHETAIIVADATGHGLAAGLLSATVLGLLHAQGQARGIELGDPAEMLTRLHESLLQYQLSECEFVAAVYAVYNERTRVVRLARAGAPQPILIRPGTAPQMINSGGMPLGVDAKIHFDSTEVQLEPGDTLLFHTDGLEALIARQADGSNGRSLVEWVEDHSEQDIRGAVQDLIAQFAPDADSPIESDDITLLSLHIN